MGSFNVKCCISGLPITGGTPVRYLLIKAPHLTDDVYGWQLRCPPLKGVYNGYGSIREKTSTSFGTRKVFFRSFDKDLIERGSGDNCYHDVGVTHEMPEKSLLTAIEKFRVSVVDLDSQGHRMDNTSDFFKTFKPTGCFPHWKSLQTTLREKSSVLKHVLADQVNVNFVRIRFGTDDPVKNWHKHVLDIVTGLGFPAMVVAGSGHYADRSEVLVGTPVQDIPVASETVAAKEQGSAYNTIPIQRVFVREDIWQYMLSRPVNHWCFKHVDLSNLLEKFQELAQKVKEYYKAEEAEPFFGATLFRYKFHPDPSEKQLAAAHFFESTIGIVGYDLGASLCHAAQLLEDSELREFVQDLFETCMVDYQFSVLHGQWAPQISGWQIEDWEAYISFHKFLQSCAKRARRENAW